jgi:CBS domain-containing protein
MRRINIRAAFVGEPSYASESSAAEESDEAVALVVRGGEVLAVVPPGTPDARVLEAATTLRGTLHLENEQVLTFEIQDGAVGAFFEHEAAERYYRRQAQGGLFTFPAGPARPTEAPARARDLMRTTLVTVPPDAPVAEVARLLAFHQISGLLVVEGAQLVGVVTEADLLSKQGQTAGDIMTREVVAVSEDATAEEIARLLTERRIRRVPVVREGRPVGVVTRGDLVRWLARRQAAAAPGG